MTSHIKELYIVSRQVASRPVLIQQLINEIEGQSRFASLLHGFQHALNRIELGDLGVNASTVEGYFRPGVIAYSGIYEEQELAICVFALSAGCKMPLHDHPQMAVLTRVVTGKLRIRQADLHESTDSGYLFHEVRSGEVAAPVTFMLTPSSANLHEFEALEDTILLDVIMPNYSELRQVTYYQQTDETHLKPMTPENLCFREVKYSGESIGDTWTALY